MHDKGDRSPQFPSGDLEIGGEMALVGKLSEGGRAAADRRTKKQGARFPRRPLQNFSRKNQKLKSSMLVASKVVRPAWVFIELLASMVMVPRFGTSKVEPTSFLMVPFLTPTAK